MRRTRVPRPIRCRSLLACLIPAALLCGIACAPPREGGPETTAGPSEEVIALNSLGTAYLGQQRWNDAQEAFRKAQAIDPSQPLPLNNIGVALIQQGEVDKAQATLEQALALDPTNPYAHYNLGLIEKNRGNFEQAAVHFEAVADFDPEDLLTQYNLGIVLSRTGRDDEARVAFERALERDPTHVSTLYGLGQFLLRHGEVDEGRGLVARSAEIRARSGLDEAVGSQYGEQGPYAMGADYPGGALPAPAVLPVRFDVAAEGELAGAEEPVNVPATTLILLPGETAPALLVADGKAVRRLGPAGWSDAPVPEAGGPILALTAIDIDNDGTAELAAAVGEPNGLAPWLARVDGAGGWSWQPGGETFSGPARVGPTSARRAAMTAVDRDHDGDVDLYWCWSGADAGCALATNDGSGRFDARGSTEHGFAPVGRVDGPVWVGFSDLDNDRDVDLLLGEPGGFHWFSNQRDGTFEDVAAAAGLATAGSIASVEVADFNKDGWMDLLFGGADGVRAFVNRRGKFALDSTFPAVASAAAEPLVLDYDNDGFLDVVAIAGDGGIRLLRNDGAGRWSEQPTPLAEVAATGGAHPLAALDADGDGDLDFALVRPDGVVALLRNEGGNARHWIAIDASGIGDNRHGIGAKVEVLSGALRQKFEVTRPVALHAGLGERQQVESVRFLWPNGVLQDETSLPAGGATEITQLDRKGTSCPLLYAGAEDGWRFVTDFLGGAAVGYQQARGVFNTPDTDEYVKIDGGIHEDADGALRLRLNNQLEEVIWFDQVELVVVDHPRGTEVFPNERLMPGPPWPEHRLFAGSDQRPVAAAREVERDRDVTRALAAADRRYVDGFELLAFKGYATRHTLELDLGPFPRDGRVVLLLDGWIDYADSTSNLAAEQAGVRLVPPRLTVADGNGGWAPTGHRMGFPAGLPKTMAVELSGLFASDDHRVRIETNMRIYWDRARVLVGGEETPLRVARLSPRAAELRDGGFPRPTSPDGRPPFAYDPGDVAPINSWKAHVGSYTAFGDVRELLLALDDRFVTTRSGDEIELRFDAPAPPPPGWTRTYLMYADGFGKDMDPNSAANNELAPIPFHGMPGYPYPEDVARPTAAVDSRPARRVLPSDHGWPGAYPQRLAGELSRPSEQGSTP